MNERIKRILIIIGFIGITALFAFLIWTFLFTGPPSINPDQPDDTTSGTSGVLPGSNTGGQTVIPDGGENDTTTDGGLPISNVANGGLTAISLLTTAEVQATNINGNTISYYDPADGNFYTIDEEGNVVALSTASFPNAETVKISNDSQVAAIEFPDGSNVLYDFLREDQITLPNHWEDFAFSPTSDEVVGKSIGLDPNNRSLIITQSDGSKTEVIASLGENADKVDVNWSPNNQIVGFSQTGGVVSGFGRKEIYLIGTDGEERGAIIVEGGNFEAMWNPTGSHILYSVADASDGNRPSLWYTNATGNVGSERKKFNIQTWVDKCTFYSGSTVYCAVPREVTVESGYDHGLVSAYDDVYSLDISTGRATLIAVPATDTQMFNLYVSSDQSTLYFRDAGGRLNSMQLR